MPEEQDPGQHNAPEEQSAKNAKFYTGMHWLRKFRAHKFKTFAE